MIGLHGEKRAARAPSWRRATRVGVSRYSCGAIAVGLALLLLLQISLPEHYVEQKNQGSATGSIPLDPSPALSASAIGTSSSSPAIATAPSVAEPAPANTSLFSWSSARAPPLGNLTGSGFASDPGPEEAVLFGGSNSTGPLNQTWAYWESNDTWAGISTPTAPTPRSDFGFAGDPNSNTAILFGGRTNDLTSRVAADTWVFNFTLGTWTNVTKGAAPAARQDPAFAVAPGLGEALLYGGWNRNFSGTGALIYSDAWILNLTSYTWSSAPITSSEQPPPLEGASLGWDPSLAQFELFGGCFPCVSTVWRYTPATGNWSEASKAGPVPTPRGSTVWAYDPAQNLDVLWGGQGNSGPLNDTYTWNPATESWAALSLANHPSGLSVAAATWMDVPTNETLLLTEGSGPKAVADLWRLAPLANVSVLVLNLSSALPVERATVTLDGSSPGFTSAFGYRNLTAVTPVEHFFTAIAPGYAPANRTLWIDPGLVTHLVLNLMPVPPSELTVQVVNQNGEGIGGATVGVLINGVQFQTPLLLTNAGGFANYTGIPTFPAEVTASAVYYHSSSEMVDLVSGQHTYAQLQLTPFPVALVHIIGYLPPLGFSWPLFNARVSVDPESVGYTDATGRLLLQLNVDGGVTFNASAAGFQPNLITEQAPFTGEFPVNMTLMSLPFGAVDIQVLDADSHLPLSGADVNFTVFSGLPLNGLEVTARSSATGYSNESYPPTSYGVTVEHAGYITNTSLTNFTVHSSSVEAITVNLTPLPPSPNPGGNGSFYLFPPGQPIAWIFLLVPLLLLLAGATYLALTRGDRPTPRSVYRTRRAPKPPPPPDPRLFPPPPPGE